MARRCCTRTRCCSISQRRTERRKRTSSHDMPRFRRADQSYTLTSERRVAKVRLDIGALAKHAREARHGGAAGHAGPPGPSCRWPTRLLPVGRTFRAVAAAGASSATWTHWPRHSLRRSALPDEQRSFELHNISRRFFHSDHERLVSAERRRCSREPRARHAAARVGARGGSERLCGCARAGGAGAGGVCWAVVAARDDSVTSACSVVARRGALAWSGDGFCRAAHHHRRRAHSDRARNGRRRLCAAKR